MSTAVLLVWKRPKGETTESLCWTVAKLGHIQAVQDEHTLRLERVETTVERIKTVQEDHTLRLGRVETRLERVETKLGHLEHKLDGLMEALPGMVAEAVRSSR
jgi:chromosome segregation ATPase